MEVEKPKLYVTGVSSWIAVLHQAVQVARANNIIVPIMLKDLKEAGDLEDCKRRLSFYFKVV